VRSIGEELGNGLPEDTRRHREHYLLDKDVKYKGEYEDNPPLWLLGRGEDLQVLTTTIESDKTVHMGHIRAQADGLSLPVGEIVEIAQKTYSKDIRDGNGNLISSEKTPPEEVFSFSQPYASSTPGTPFTRNVLSIDAVRGRPPARENPALIPLSKQLPHPTLGSGQLANLEYQSTDTLDYRITTEEGLQTYYLRTGDISSTIQSLRTGGGGLPNANYVFWAPFPNPLYQLRQQTGPIRYLKNPDLQHSTPGPAAEPAGFKNNPMPLHGPLPQNRVEEMEKALNIHEKIMSNLK